MPFVVPFRASVGLFFVLAALPATVHAEDVSVPNKTVVGELTVGGSLATGNTERSALDAEANIKYRSGRVLDEYKFSGELARESGITTAERIKGGYQTNIDIQDGLFGLAFVNAEDDRFSGFDYEVESGIGAGYRVINTTNLLVSVEGGPGYRYSKAPAPSITEKEIFARASAEVDYKISENATLNDEITVSWDDERTKVENTLSLSSKIYGALSGRTSFNVRYNSTPPTATLDKTDTITKVALVYRF
jgi:putative salt-induced outer membrane protein